MSAAALVLQHDEQDVAQIKHPAVKKTDIISFFDEYGSTYSINIFRDLVFVGDTINKCPPISNYSLDWWRNRNSRELES
jgi:hypothetical protein